MFIIRTRSTPKITDDKREYLSASIRSSVQSVLGQCRASETLIKTRYSSGVLRANHNLITVLIYDRKEKRTPEFYKALAEVVGRTVKFICPDNTVRCITNLRSKERSFWSSTPKPET